MRSLTGRKIPIIIAVFSALCVIAGIALALMIRSTIVYTGVQEFTDPAVMAKADIQIRAMLTEESWLRYFEAEGENLMSEPDSASAVFVVETEGGIQQLQSCFVQDLTVLEVLRCDDPSISAGSHIQLITPNGINYDEGQYYFDYIQNILYSGNRYLVFLHYPVAGHYADIPYFNPVDNILSIINLDRSHASEPCPSYDFNECRNQVRFTSSKKIASLFASLEELLLEKYLGARNEQTSINS